MKSLRIKWCLGRDGVLFGLIRPFRAFLSQQNNASLYLGWDDNQRYCVFSFIVILSLFEIYVEVWMILTSWLVNMYDCRLIKAAFSSKLDKHLSLMFNNVQILHTFWAYSQYVSMYLYLSYLANWTCQNNLRSFRNLWDFLILLMENQYFINLSRNWAQNHPLN